MGAAASIAVLAFLLMYGQTERAHAAASVTLATGGGAISADTAAGAPGQAWTSLTQVQVIEGLAADISVGAGVTITLLAPAGFEFNTGQVPSISGPAGDITATAVAVTNATTITATITAGNTLTVDTISIGASTAIQVRPTAGTPLASGNITRGGTAVIAGVVGGANLGTLTEVVGAANKLAVTTQPSASTVAGVAFAQQPIVTVQDRFGNTRTGDSATVVTAALTTGAGTLSGTLTKTAASGVASFAGQALSINLTGADKVLTFTGGGLTAATTAPAFAITVAAANAGLSVISAAPTSVDEGGTSTITVQAKDAFGNLRTSSSGAVVLSTNIGALGAVTDAGNGTYTATLSAGTPGTATISGTLGGAAIGTNATVTVSAVPPSSGDGTPPPAPAPAPAPAPTSAPAPSPATGITGEPGIVATGIVPSPDGIGLLVTSGPTTTAQLTTALALRGCTMASAAVLQAGVWRVYIPGAPAVVNASFPAELATATAFFVRC